LHFVSSELDTSGMRYEVPVSPIFNMWFSGKNWQVPRRYKNVNFKSEECNFCYFTTPTYVTFDFQTNEHGKEVWKWTIVEISAIREKYISLGAYNIFQWGKLLLFFGLANLTWCGELKKVSCKLWKCFWAEMWKSTFER
jgi:hypothetical protein